MPSPTRQTRIKLEASEFLQPLSSKDGIASIPSIPAGHTVTLQTSIKALICERTFSPGTQPYKITATVVLKAIMPGLNRRLNNFDFQRTFEIQYPLELREIDFLPSVAQGSENKLSIQIYNPSNKKSVLDRASPRRVEVKISIDPKIGSLLSPSGIWSPEVFQQTENLPAKSTLDMSQTFHISHSAKDHAYTKIQVDFLISSPGPAPAIGKSLGDLGVPMRLVQSFELKMQISAAHVQDEEAEIIVVTNFKTPPERFEAIGDFIRKELRLKMDVWNVSWYGGMIVQDQNEEDDGILTNVLERYRGHTIIFLGNRFDHFGLQNQTMINLCDSGFVGNDCFAGSSFLLLGCEANPKNRNEWLEQSVFPLTHKIPAITAQMLESATFGTKAAFAQSIAEQRISGIPTPQAYKIECQSKWYHGGSRLTVKHQAKRTKSYLKSILPQERFLVCPVCPRTDSEPSDGYVAIWHGLPSNRNILSTESKKLLEERGKPKKLHPFDSFNIICSLPYSLRIDLLDSFSTVPTPVVERTRDDDSSAASQDPTPYSDEILNAVQFSLDERINHEIETYLRPSPFINNISLGSTHNPLNEFRTHFPCLNTVLSKLHSSTNTPSPRLLEILKLALAATNPQTITQIPRSLMLPLLHRRSQLKAHLLALIETLLSSKSYTPTLLKEFRSSAQTRHSCFNSHKRDTAKLILERNKQFVKVSMNTYLKGRVGTEDLVVGTQVCGEEEWDARCEKMERERGSLKRSVTRAMAKRGKMSTLKLPTAGSEEVRIKN
jgi:hypothetical protein